LPIAYPDVLSDKAWQKQKGAIAKTKSTGVGKTLIALEKTYQASDFAKSDPQSFAKQTNDPPSYAKRRASLEVALGMQGKKLVPLVAKSVEAIKGAKVTFAKDKKLLPYLAQMEKALIQFKTDFAPGGRQAGQLLQQADREFKYLFGQTRTGKFATSDTAGRTEKARADVLAMIKKIEAAGTVAEIAAQFKGNGPHRTLTTSCELWDNFFAKDCPTLVKSIYAGAAKQEFGHLPWMWEVANEANLDASNAVSALAQRSSEDRAVTKFALEYSRSVIEYKKFVEHMRAFEAAARKWL
jgi:hypothetical protein